MILTLNRSSDTPWNLHRKKDLQGRENKKWLTFLSIINFISTFLEWNSVISHIEQPKILEYVSSWAWIETATSSHFDKKENNLMGSVHFNQKMREHMRNYITHSFLFRLCTNLDNIKQERKVWCRRLRKQSNTVFFSYRNKHSIIFLTCAQITHIKKHSKKIPFYISLHMNWNWKLSWHV